MAAELVINSGVPAAMPGALMLLLALAVGTLASYVALDLARRVRVVRTRSRAASGCSARRRALSLGIWSSQIIGIAAEPLAFPVGYDGWRLAHRLGGGAGGRPGRARRRRRQDRHPRCGSAWERSRSVSGIVGAHVLSFDALGLQPGVDWQLLSLVAAVAGACGGSMLALGAFFRGGDRSKPPTVPWQTTAAAGARRHPGRQPAAGRRRRRARRRRPGRSMPTGSPRAPSPCSPRSARSPCCWSA